VKPQGTYMCVFSHKHVLYCVNKRTSVISVFSDVSKAIVRTNHKFLLMKLSAMYPWALEGLFPRGASRGFFFLGGAKSSEICFFPLTIKKTTFFAEIFNILWGLAPPTSLPTPMNVPTCMVRMLVNFHKNQIMQLK